MEIDSVNMEKKTFYLTFETENWLKLIVFWCVCLFRVSPRWKIRPTVRLKSVRIVWIFNYGNKKTSMHKLIIVDSFDSHLTHIFHCFFSQIICQREAFARDLGNWIQHFPKIRSAENFRCTWWCPIFNLWMFRKGWHQIVDVFCWSRCEYSCYSHWIMTTMICFLCVFFSVVKRRFLGMLLVSQSGDTSFNFTNRWPAWCDSFNWTGIGGNW